MLIEGGGNNLSVGQRQLICLARAFCERPKILLMDEATANIDEKTDKDIQNLIKTQFRDTTIVTVAHRLNTIIQYDKILVQNKGAVEEFGTPRELLGKRNGYFNKMVSENGKSYVDEMWDLINKKETADEIEGNM